MTAARLLVLACVLVASAGCSLLVDTSELDEGCPPDAKLCDGCVSKNDPAYGCGDEGCEPCPTSHAVPICKDGECAADFCEYGYGCDNCTANLLTEEGNCGECEHRCSAGERCVAGMCVICRDACPSD